MKNRFVKVLSILVSSVLISLILCMNFWGVLVSAENGKGDNSGDYYTDDPLAQFSYVNVEASYKTGDKDVCDVTGFVYNDGFFFTNSSVMNPEIAKISVGLANMGYDYNYLTGALGTMGFSFQGYNWYRTHTMNDMHFVRFVIASKEVVFNGEPYIIYLVPVQGTNGSFDWNSDFTIGDGDDHYGFYESSNEIMEKLHEVFLEEQYDGDHTILLTTGHSRGAAVANIVAGELTAGYSRGTDLSFSSLISAKNVFAYTFACPAVSKNVAVTGTDFYNIHNFNNFDDLIPTLPLEEWGYKRYGQSYFFSDNYRAIVSDRYNQVFGTDYKGDYYLAPYFDEIIATLIQNSSVADGFTAQSVFNALAYLLHDEKSLGDFLFALGCYIDDYALEQINDRLNGEYDNSILKDYYNYVNALIDDIPEFISETEDMNQEEFNAWFDSHRDQLEEIEGLFSHNIVTKMDLQTIYLLSTSNALFCFMGEPMNASTFYNIVTVACELWYYCHDSQQGIFNVKDSIAHGHNPATYVFWTNAMFFGYKGCYYNANIREANIYNPNSAYGIVTIGTSCFECNTQLGTINIQDTVRYISDCSFYNDSALSTINNPENAIEYVGEAAFYNCNSISSISFPNAKSIRKQAFYDCNSIDSIILPKAIYIGSQAFYNCCDATEIYIPEARALGSKAFYMCMRALSATVSAELDYVKPCKSSVYDLYIDKEDDYDYSANGGPFSGCMQIGTVYIAGNGDMVDNTAEQFVYTPWFQGYAYEHDVSVVIEEGVRSIGKYCFYRCPCLVNITIPSTVTDIGSYAFYGCSSLRSNLNLPSGLKSIGSSAFNGCVSMPGNITLPSGLTSLGASAFSDCSSLTGSLLIPGSIKTIESEAFSGCSSLDGTLTIGEGVEEIEFAAFAGCEKLSGTLHFPDSLNKIGNNAFSDCKGFSGDLIVPPHISSIDERAFFNCSGLEAVYINEGVSSILKEAFANCSKVTSVSIPNTVTELGFSSFKNCSLLNALTAPAIIYYGNFTNTTNPFTGCSSISQIHLTGNFNMPNYTINGSKMTPWHIASDASNDVSVVIDEGVLGIGDRNFYGCNNLVSANIPSTVTTIGEGAFGYCSRLAEQLILPEGLTYIGAYAFYECTNLTGDINIPNGVEIISSYAFYDCFRIGGKITLPHGLKEIRSRAFWGCSSLTGDLIIPDQVECIDIEAFYGCSGLESLVITNSSIRLGVSAFAKCSGISEMTLPGAMDVSNYNPIVPNVTTVPGETFAGCTGLRTLRFTGNGAIPSFPNRKYYSSSKPWFYHNLSEKGGITVIIDEGITGIGDYVFYDCWRIESVSIPSTVTSIGSHAFSGSNLTANDLILPEGLTYIGDYAFQDCSGLTGNLTLPEGVTYIGDYAFQNCSNLTGNLTLPEGLTRIGSHTFDNCSGLTGDLHIPDGVDIIGIAAFLNCSGLNGNITLPENLTQIGNYAFQNCSNLTGNINLPEGLTRIGSHTFDNCSGLTGELRIPDGVESIGSGAFRSCSGLTGELRIPDGVKYIDSEAFMGCSGFNGQLILPESLTDIGYYAFRGCRGLTGELRIPNGVEEIDTGAFMLCRSINDIIIPEGLTSIHADAFYGCISLDRIIIYNPKCEIYDDLDTISTSAVIYGYMESTAHEYALKYNREFVALDSKISVTSISLNLSSASIFVGETLMLSAEVSPDNATDKNVIWSSSNTSVATVNESGQITAVGYGSCYITVTSNDGEFSDKCDVTVSIDYKDYDITPNINGGASKLYEPWGLRYFAAFNGEDIDKITDRGIAILKDSYYTDGMTADEFCAAENAHIYLDSEGELGFEAASTNNPNGRYYATLTEGIYSYDISAYYYVVPFAVMENGQTVYGTIKKNSMEKILNTNLNLTSITTEEKEICTCILDLKESVAAHYAASGVPGASIDMEIPRGSSQAAAASTTTTAQSGITPNIVAGASRLIEPWGLRYFATYTDSGSIADRGVVILCEKYFDSSYKTAQDKMRLNANSYVFTESNGTLLYDEGSGRYYATVTEGISSKDIADVYYVVPYVVLENGSYVYGTVKSNSMMKIMNTNLSITSVSETEKEVSRDIIALYEAVQAYYAA